MVEVSFYHLQREPLEAALPKILEKVLERGLRGQVYNVCSGVLRPVRAVLETAGVHDILTKTLGTNNPRNVVNAVMAGLQDLQEPEARLAELGRVRS